ncbi:uncharacterized protein LOC141719505 [Apium graveolens]|uniref:uncharacterized protein LOC141719505 n=1 Tax=Apium graveolens TaxID=4045 RepID=UPI003D78C19F
MVISSYIELGHNPNFVWRSVFDAKKQVIKIEVIRRVGIDMDIDVLNDPRLPCDDNPKITIVHPTFIGATVSSLMLTGGLTWDSDLVRDLFNERDVRLIISITLSSSRVQDVRYRSFEISCLFSVKSTNRHLQETKDECVNIVDFKFWKKLWKLRGPSKVKDMLWRAASNCLSTKTLLHSKHAAIDSLCPLCQEQRETVPHCLLDGRLITAEYEKRNMVAMTCRAIWTTQNNQVWKNTGATIDVGSDRCIKPEGTVLKINVDVTLFTEAQSFSFACVARDSSRMILEAIARCRVDTVNLDMAEAMRVREALI